MKSKTSFFNRTVYRKNVTLFWPVWGCFLLYELFSGPLYLWINFGKMKNSRLEVLLGSIDAGQSIAALAVAALVTGMGLFNYLFLQKSANMIHALPVTRLELYGTNLISGFSFLFIPEIVSFLLSVLVCLANGVTQVQYLGMWLLACLGISFFFFSLVTFCAMFTGLLFALPVYFVICNVLVEGIVYGVSWLIGQMAYGVTQEPIQGHRLSFLSPYLHLTDEVWVKGVYSSAGNRDIYEMTNLQMAGAGTIGAYAAAAVFIYILAYYGYRKRQIESAGDLLTFYWVRPVFRWGFGICAGFLGGTAGMHFMQDISSHLSNWVWAALVILAGILAFFIAQMLIEKAFRVVNVRLCRECAAFAACLGLAFALVFGLAWREAHFIPKEEDVVFAYVDMNYPVEFSGADVGQVILLQQEILEKQMLLEEELAENEAENGSGYVTITYRMKDGSVRRRGYMLPSAADVSDDMLGRINGWETAGKNFLRQYIEYGYAGIERVTDAQLEWYDTDTANYIYRTVEGDGARALFDAIMADAEEGVLQKYNLTDYRESATERVYEEHAQLYVYYYHASDDWQSMYDRMNGAQKTAPAGEPGADGRGAVYVTFGGDCRNIIRALLDCGIIESGEELGETEYETQD